MSKTNIGIRMSNMGSPHRCDLRVITLLLAEEKQSPEEPARKGRVPMHPYVSQRMTDQHRSALLANGEAWRLAQNAQVERRPGLSPLLVKVRTFMIKIRPRPVAKGIRPGYAR